MAQRGPRPVTAPSPGLREAAHISTEEQAPGMQFSPGFTVSRKSRQHSAPADRRESKDSAPRAPPEQVPKVKVNGEVRRNQLDPGTLQKYRKRKQDSDDELDETLTQDSHAKEMDEILKKQIEIAQGAVAAFASGAEALSNELKHLRIENLQLREALGAGCTSLQGANEVTTPLSYMKSKPGQSMRNSGNTIRVVQCASSDSEDNSGLAHLPGAIDNGVEKLQVQKYKKHDLSNDKSLKVPVPKMILSDPAPPDLPPTNNLLSEQLRVTAPSPRSSFINPGANVSQQLLVTAPSPRTSINEPEPSIGDVYTQPVENKARNVEKDRHAIRISRISAPISEPYEHVNTDENNNILKSMKAELKRSRTKNLHMFADVDAMKEKVQQAICSDEYNVSNYYKTKGFAQAIARTKFFETFILIIIACNAVWIGVDTDFNHTESLYDADLPFVLAENAFCVIFIVEWLIRFFAFDDKTNCLKDGTFMFDSVLVLSMVIETWLMSLIIKWLGLTDVGNASILRLIRLLKLTRMARMARLLRAFPEIMVLIKAMAVAMRSVCFTLGLMVLILYVFGIAFTQLARGTLVGERFFSCVGDSMNTLLNHALFLEGMPEVINEVGAESWLLRAFFLMHILLASLTVMNMLVGLLVEVVSVISAVEKEQMQVQYVKNRLSKIIFDFNLDADENGLVTKDEFQLLLAKPEAARALRDVGVDVVGLVDFQDYIFPNDQTLSFSKFMELVLSLRGTNKATVKDIIDVRKLLKGELGRIEHRLQLLLDSQDIICPPYYRSFSAQQIEEIA